MRGKIVFLEWVRGVAALLVVFQHALEKVPAWNSFSREWIDLGRVGVVAFFLVSGYVIPLSLEKQDIRTFLVRRFWRLYPLYFVALALFLVESGHYFSSKDVLTSVLVLLVNASMLQQLLGLQALLPPAWTLSIEWMFYCQQVMFKKLRNLETAWIAGYFWVVIFFVACMLEHVSGRHLPTSLPMLLAVSGLGNAWYMLHNKRITLTAFRNLLFFVGALVPAGYAIGLDDDLWNYRNASLSFLIGIALFATFASLGEVFEFRLLVWFGGLSYAIYLLEPMAMNLVARMFPEAGGTQTSLIVVLAVGMAFLAHKAIELPCISYGRRVAQSSLVTKR